MKMSKLIFENMAVITYPKNSCDSRAPPQTPLGTTTVPRPPHTSALGVAGERIAADARLGERGPWRSALPGTDRSLPGKWADLRELRGSQHLRRPFPPGVAPTLTSRQHFHTKFNMQITTPILRYKYDTNFKIFFSTRFFSLKSKKKVKNEFPELAPRQN